MSKNLSYTDFENVTINQAFRFKILVTAWFQNLSYSFSYSGVFIYLPEEI